jgi:hypothetical protein
MRVWLRIAARFYPTLWRARYGTELEALLDDADPAWTDLFDILREALIMHSRAIFSYLKLPGAAVLASVLVAAAMFVLAPKSYVASTLIGPLPGSHPTDSGEVSDQVVAAWQEAVSRQSLSEIIQRPTLNLYRTERRRKPIGDVIEDMQRDLHLAIVTIKGAPQFRVSFTYPDPYKAQLVVTALTTHINDSIAVKKSRLKFQVTAPSKSTRAHGQTRSIHFPRMGNRCRPHRRGHSGFTSLARDMDAESNSVRFCRLRSSCLPFPVDRQ